MFQRKQLLVPIIAFLLGGFFLLTFLPLTPNAYAGVPVCCVRPSFEPFCFGSAEECFSDNGNPCESVEPCVAPTPCTCIPQIPTLNQYGIFIMIGVLALFGIIGLLLMRRKQHSET